jgi:hypothetical protein
MYKIIHDEKTINNGIVLKRENTNGNIGLKLLFEPDSNHADLGNGTIDLSFQTEPINSQTSGHFSFITGLNTIAKNEGQFAGGKWNIGEDDTVFEIGIGSFRERKNGLEIKSDGTVLAPELDVSKITDENSLVTKKYADSFIANDPLWTHYFYADPALSRVVEMDHNDMVLASEIPCSANSTPYSIDRAGFTDKMYARTTNQQAFDVIDARYKEYIKTVSLPHKPRAAGAYNKYRNLQLISGKDDPMVSVIDVATDDVVVTMGQVASGTISGNCGGNATGHSIWVDADHFTLLDRYNDTLVTYRIDQDQDGNYSATETQTINLVTGAHAIDVDNLDLSLTKTQFFAEIEGSDPSKKNVVPQITELIYNGDGTFTENRTLVFENNIGYTDISSTDMTHHYSISPDGTQIWQPICNAAVLFVIDINTFSIVKEYSIGVGGGHVNFSTALDLAVVTNHFDPDVTIIDMTTDEVWNVEVAHGTDSDGVFKQSHLNYVSPDGLFFYLFATHDGTFIEIDLTTKEVSRTVYTGGTPEQSTS